MNRIGLAKEAESRLCTDDEETAAEHILCTCPVVTRIKHYTRKVDITNRESDRNLFQKDNRVYQKAEPRGSNINQLE